MKHLLTFFLFQTISTAAFAHPGGSTLICKSFSGAKQMVELSLKRSNGIGYFNPQIEINVDKKNFVMTTPDEMNNYGHTFHNSPLKVITATVEVPYEDTNTAGSLSVVAIPESVKAFDWEGNTVIWSMEAEKDECNDVHGKATFKGIMRGYIYTGGESTNVEAQIMDCELTYDPGMSC